MTRADQPCTPSITLVAIGIATARPFIGTPPLRARYICSHCRGIGSHPVIDPAAVVAAIYSRVGDRAFVLRELLEYLMEDEVLMEEVGELTRPELGLLLKKHAGRDLAGLMIERIGEEREGVVWHIAEVRHLR